MNAVRKSTLLLAMLLGAAVLSTGAALAQQLPAGPGRGAGQRAGAAPAPATAAQVQALFDAMVVVEAQKRLGLSDEQYPQFVSRLKALQEARRRGRRERLKIIQEIAQLTGPNQAPADEGVLREKLRALAQVDAQTAGAVAKAYEGIDQVLDVGQQARFRVFEEQIERRKFQFLLGVRGRGVAGRGIGSQVAR